MRHLLPALLFVATATLVLAAGVRVGAPVPPTAVGSHGSVVLQLDWLVDLIRQADRILEAVVDLLDTLGRLSGEGGD